MQELQVLNADYICITVMDKKGGESVVDNDKSSTWVKVQIRIIKYWSSKSILLFQFYSSEIFLCT